MFCQNAPVITLNDKVDAEAPNSTNEYMMSTEEVQRTGICWGFN